MKNLILLIVLTIPILSFTQSENFELNNCVSTFEISFYDKSYADSAYESHKLPTDKEINIIIGDRAYYLLDGISYSDLDEMLKNLIEYQKTRTYISDYYFSIGVHHSAHFYALEELLCGLKSISSEIKSSSTVKLYMY